MCLCVGLRPILEGHVSCHLFFVDDAKEEVAPNQEDAAHQTQSECRIDTHQVTQDDLD
jgi:hypothetical protein